MPDYREVLCRALIVIGSLYTVQYRTGGFKEKYQIYLRKTLLDIYIFYTTTSNQKTIDKDISICIEPTDWEDIEIDGLKNSNTHVVLDHINPMSFKEIFAKRLLNHFSYSGNLSEVKIEELKDKFIDSKKSLLNARINADVKKIGDFAILGLEEDAFIDGALNRMKI